MSYFIYAKVDVQFKCDDAKKNSEMKVFSLD